MAEPLPSLNVEPTNVEPTQPDTPRVDLSPYGYRVLQSLGHNPMGGRMTYRAQALRTGQVVVIKQFQFAQAGSSWSAYQAHEQEIRLLQSLDHPRIPRYLHSFETPSGFCLVQEYKPAPHLGQLPALQPDQVLAIARETLHILVYLQQQRPPIIHRDLKPENILLERLPQPRESPTVYLVDFGFAHVGEGGISASSLLKGTLGFMPPEQLLRRELTPASDLYSLGATLICLLTHTRSADLGHLIDNAYRFNLHRLPPAVHPAFRHWLGQMVCPNPQGRFLNAAEALLNLEGLPAVRGGAAIAPLRQPPKSQNLLSSNRSAGVMTVGGMEVLVVDSRARGGLYIGLSPQISQRARRVLAEIQQHPQAAMVTLAFVAPLIIPVTLFGLTRISSERPRNGPPQIEPAEAPIPSIHHLCAQGISPAKATWEKELPRVAAIQRVKQGIDAYGVGHIDCALRLWQQAIALDKTLAAAYNNLGVAYAEQRDWEEAIAAFNQALQLEPGYGEANANLGHTLERNHKLEQAMAVYTRALVFRPDDNRSSYTLLVQAIPGAGREHVSAQVFTTVQTKVNRAPAQAQAQHQWGLILATQGKLDAAITAYRRTLDLDPDYRDTRMSLAIALAASGRQGEALGQLDQLEGHRGQSERPTYARSDRLGQLRKAIQSWQYR